LLRATENAENKISETTGRPPRGVLGVEAIPAVGFGGVRNPDVMPGPNGTGWGGYHAKADWGRSGHYLEVP